ncbi:hypothetical protein EJ07DRAFT_107154 [Lizonia empirigonia]|nr:hypothetical protein EJ07DRAFT_107154 [Lizonia empirigonia]
MHSQPQPPTVRRRWTPVEDTQLMHLRLTEHKTWPEVAAILQRNTKAVQFHYHQLRRAQHSSFEDWNATMDDQIIDGRSRGLSLKEIGVEMDLPYEAIQGRWYELKQQKKVPEDVLAISRRKTEVEWTEKEDSEILKAWVEGKKDDEIAKTLKLTGKYERDVRERRRQLCREAGPLYRRLMGMKEDQPVPGAMDRALGKKKFAWMK